MAFQIGEKVVYPNQGIATIENISSRSFGANFERFYLLRLASGSMTVMLPFSHAGDVGLRKITGNGELARVLDFLAAGRCPCRSNWKDRFKENTEKMRIGDLPQIAEVLKSLLLLQREKPLSFREKKMLDRARQMLVMELSTSRNMPPEAAGKLIEQTLAKASLNLPPAL